MEALHNDVPLARDVANRITSGNGGMLRKTACNSQSYPGVAWDAASGFFYENMGRFTTRIVVVR